MAMEVSVDHGYAGAAQHFKKLLLRSLEQAKSPNFNLPICKISWEIKHPCHKDAADDSCMFWPVIDFLNLDVPVTDDAYL